MTEPRTANDVLADLLGQANTRFEAHELTTEEAVGRLNRIADLVGELDQAMRDGDTVARWVRPVIKDGPALVSFTPWTDGFAVGFRVRHRVTGAVEHVYLNPSTSGDGDGDEHYGTVFLYAGTGEPGQDQALTHVDALRDPS